MSLSLDTLARLAREGYLLTPGEVEFYWDTYFSYKYEATIRILRKQYRRIYATTYVFDPTRMGYRDKMNLIRALSLYEYAIKRHMTLREALTSIWGRPYARMRNFVRELGLWSDREWGWLHLYAIAKLYGFYTSIRRGKARGEIDISIDLEFYAPEFLKNYPENEDEMNTIADRFFRKGREVSGPYYNLDYVWSTGIERGSSQGVEIGRDVEEKTAYLHCCWQSGDVVAEISIVIGTSEFSYVMRGTVDLINYGLFIDIDTGMPFVIENCYEEYNIYGVWKDLEVLGIRSASEAERIRLVRELEKRGLR